MTAPAKRSHWTLLFLIVVPLLCVAALGFFALSLQPDLENSSRELRSPSGKLKAIWQHSNPQGQEMGKDEIYIVPAEKSRLKEPLFKAERAQGLEIFWKEGEPETLVIRYQSAWVHHYKNFWQDPAEWEKIVEIKLEPMGTEPLRP